MPLQNRVDPFGRIHAVEARGLFTGNRGVIHEPDTKTLLKRRWSTKAWIICLCAFRGRRRAVMGRNARSGNAGWTELFFLDEVTALAAGHRPCFYCQRQRAKEFVACEAAFSRTGAQRVPAIDAKLHQQRLASGGPVQTIEARELPALPDGAMIAIDGNCFAKHGDDLLFWTHGGYGDALDTTAHITSEILVLTPEVTLSALRAGYRPIWHQTARPRLEAGS